MRRAYSYSRRSALERCTRQYFYDYYATNKKCGLPEDRKRQVQSVKSMSGCALLAGSILHRFARLHMDPSRNLPPSWITQTALRSFDNAIEFARDPRGRAHRLQERFPPEELVELSYEDLDGEDAAARARQKLIRALSALLEGSAVAELLCDLSGFAIHPEKRLSKLKLADWCIGGQIDVLALREGEARIIDWKLGGVEHEADSLQLYTYGWFAENVHHVPRGGVSGQRVFLGDNVVEEPQVVTDDLASVGRARLFQDIELMEELHEYGRQGREEVFRPCNQDGICNRCKYRAICHDAPLRACSNATFVSLPVPQGA
ncbi:MAG: PD-(D/E)XK nuclease family protein [Phycisphaerales bacterium]|nr:MAG: PD-(D/E)XK nuclease family protein [Phycisphaerales bacterium]